MIGGTIMIVTAVAIDRQGVLHLTRWILAGNRSYFWTGLILYAHLGAGLTWISLGWFPPAGTEPDLDGGV